MIALTLFFFFQAEDGIRDYKMTGVQTCALPIFPAYRGGDFLAAIVGVEIYRVAMDDRIFQLGRAPDGRVFGEVRLNGGNGRVLDVLGRREVRLASAEVDDVNALL